MPRACQGVGGEDHFEADREAIAGAAEVGALCPYRGAGEPGRPRPVVRYLVAEAGVGQFLDIGSGLPTASNVHEVAQSVALETRVVYVDKGHTKSGCAHDLEA